jgi:hypothetical protein
MLVYGDGSGLHGREDKRAVLISPPESRHVSGPARHRPTVFHNVDEPSHQAQWFMSEHPTPPTAALLPSCPAMGDWGSVTHKVLPGGASRRAVTDAGNFFDTRPGRAHQNLKNPRRVRYRLGPSAPCNTKALPRFPRRRVPDVRPAISTI